MRLLLDESTPVKLKRHLPGHEVRSVVEMGWSGVKNGKLLVLAAANFDALITVDKICHISKAMRRFRCPCLSSTRCPTSWQHCCLCRRRLKQSLSRSLAISSWLFAVLHNWSVNRTNHGVRPWCGSYRGAAVVVRLP
jgi:hypothetical protein